MRGDPYCHGQCIFGVVNLIEPSDSKLVLTLEPVLKGLILLEHQ